MKLRKYLHEGYEKLREKSGKLRVSKTGTIDIKTIVAVVIAILVALVLLPIVIDATNSAESAIRGGGNVTEQAANDSTSATLVVMIPLFYILGVLLSAVVYAVIQAKKV